MDVNEFLKDLQEHLDNISDEDFFKELEKAGFVILDEPGKIILVENEI